MTVREEPDRPPEGASCRRLSEIESSQRVCIRDIPDDDVRAHLLRVGLLDGPVRCRAHITNGPVVIERNGTTMAVGAGVAEQITITPEE